MEISYNLGTMFAKNQVSDTSVYSIHNQVELIRGGADYFLLIGRLINEAEYSIHLQTYIFEQDESGIQIATALMKAAQRGVQVYVLLDGYASQDLTDEFIQQLKDNGVHFHWFEPVFRSRYFYFGRRLHHKLVVTDALHSLVGGMNISNRYNDIRESKAWLDWALHCDGEVNAGLHNLCVEFWNRSGWNKNKKLLQRIETTKQIHTNECLIRIRRNDWVRRKNEISRSYLEMFRKAESHILMMSSYFLPGKVFRRNMVNAVKRGVGVKIIVAGPSDVTIVKHAERFLYRWMFKNKIELYEYKPNILHGKISTCDGKFVTVGSYNINNISAYASVELNLDVQNNSFAEKVEQVMETIIKTDCVRITEKEFELHNSFIKRVWQELCYGIIRLGFFLFTFYFKQQD